MTSRYEAIEKALADYIWTHETIEPAKLAHIAIEANDAWLAEQRNLLPTFRCECCNYDTQLQIPTNMPCRECGGDRQMTIETDG